jgi:hypothetical protein
MGKVLSIAWEVGFPRFGFRVKFSFTLGLFLFKSSAQVAPRFGINEALSPQSLVSLF